MSENGSRGESDLRKGGGKRKIVKGFLLTGCTYCGELDGKKYASVSKPKNQWGKSSEWSQVSVLKTSSCTQPAFGGQK